MAGILDSKERMIDFIITPQGRSQVGDGRLKIEYATLTDLQTFYTSSRGDGVADDASDRIYFETNSSQTDLITPEISPNSNMQPFRAGSFSVQGSRMAEGTFSARLGGVEVDKTLSGTAVPQSAGNFLRSIARHFSGLRIIGTEDQFSNTSEFDLGVTTGSFLITDRDMEINSGKGIYLKDSTPNDPNVGHVILENSPSIYADPRFSHLPNFKYLPPVNVTNPDGSGGDQLGVYPRLDSDPSFIDTSDQPGGKLSSGKKLHNPAGNHLKFRQKIDVNIKELSRSKNLVTQVFEFRNYNGISGIEKLSIVDYGVIQDGDGPMKHVFFIGKMIRDSDGVDTFMNVFTMFFYNEEDKSEVFKEDNINPEENVGTVFAFDDTVTLGNTPTLQGGPFK